MLNVRAAGPIVGGEMEPSTLPPSRHSLSTRPHLAAAFFCASLRLRVENTVPTRS